MRATRCDVHGLADEKLWEKFVRTRRRFNAKWTLEMALELVLNVAAKVAIGAAVAAADADAAVAVAALMFDCHME